MCFAADLQRLAPTPYGVVDQSPWFAVKGTECHEGAAINVSDRGT